MAVNDTNLIRQCCAGDHRAWDLLIRRYGPLVRAVPKRYRLPDDACDDICQDVFQALLTHLHDLRDTRALAAWLITVTRRQRTRHFQSATAESLPLQDDTADEQSPESLLFDWEERLAVLSALEDLDKPCRELLHALFLDPAMPSYEQVAGRLGLAPGSVGPKRQRCLARLAQLMQPAAHPEPASPHNG